MSYVTANVVGTMQNMTAKHHRATDARANRDQQHGGDIAARTPMRFSQRVRMHISDNGNGFPGGGSQCRPQGHSRPSRHQRGRGFNGTIQRNHTGGTDTYAHHFPVDSSQQLAGELDDPLQHGQSALLRLSGLLYQTDQLRHVPR